LEKMVSIKNSVETLSMCVAQYWRLHGVTFYLNEVLFIETF
jgi:hypothetical protein